MPSDTPPPTPSTESFSLPPETAGSSCQTACSTPFCVFIPASCAWSRVLVRGRTSTNANSDSTTACKSSQTLTLPFHLLCHLPCLTGTVLIPLIRPADGGGTEHSKSFPTGSGKKLKKEGVPPAIPIPASTGNSPARTTAGLVR